MLKLAMIAQKDDLNGTKIFRENTIATHWSHNNRSKKQSWHLGLLETFYSWKRKPEPERAELKYPFFSYFLF